MRRITRLSRDLITSHRRHDTRRVSMISTRKCLTEALVLTAVVGVMAAVEEVDMGETLGEAVGTAADVAVVAVMGGTEEEAMERKA